MTSPSERQNMPLLTALGAVALLVVISLILVLARSAPPQIDPASPEGVSQRFAQAVLDHDDAGSRALLAPSMAAVCTPITADVESGVRVTLVRSDVRGDKATVHVEMSFPGRGGLFGPSDYVTRDSFELEKTGATWGVVAAPWQFMICEEMWK